MSGDLHAIGLEVESNEIRLLRLMLRLKVNSGTAGGGTGKKLSGASNRVAVLAFPQILDDSFEIGVFNVCLAPGTTHSAEVVEGQIDIPVDAGNNRW